MEWPPSAQRCPPPWWVTLFQLLILASRPLRLQNARTEAHAICDRNCHFIGRCPNGQSKRRVFSLFFLFGLRSAFFRRTKNVSAQRPVHFGSEKRERERAGQDGNAGSRTHFYCWNREEGIMWRLRTGPSPYANEVSFLKIFFLL